MDELNPIEYPPGEKHTELFVPEGTARFQQWWCHQMIDEHYADDNWNVYLLYKKLLKELYRKEYYEQNGWNFRFRMFRIAVVELGPWVRTYHAWTGVYGKKITIQLPKVRA